MPKITDIFMLVRLLLEDRKRLMLENLALRQQPGVLKRSVKKPRIEDSDRIFWILLWRVLEEWKETLHFVKPETVVKWHRRGFRYYCRRKSESVPGRPPISREVGRRILHIDVTGASGLDGGAHAAPRPWLGSVVSLGCRKPEETRSSGPSRVLR